MGKRSHSHGRRRAFVAANAAISGMVSRGRQLARGPPPRRAVSLPSRVSFRAGTKSRSRSRSRTRSRSKTRTENSQLATGNDVTGFTHNIRGKVTKRKLSFVSSIDVYRLTTGQRITVTASTQQVSLLGVDTVAGGVTFGLYSIQELEIIRALLKSAQSGTNALQAFQFAVPKGRIEYMLTNSTNANVIVYLYDIIPRKNIYSTDTMYSDPTIAWQRGLVNQSGNAVSTTINQIGATPFESKYFCANYKVMKVTKVTLSPGVLHRHVVKSTQRRWFTDSAWENIYNAAAVETTTGYWLSHRSIITMCVVFGGPAHSRADSTKIGTGAAGLDVLSLKRYEYLYSTTGVKVSTFNNNLPAAPGDLEIIDEAQNAFSTIKSVGP